MGTPSVQPAPEGVVDSRILVQPEEAVGTEVDHPPAVQLDVPVRTHLLEGEVLHQQVRVISEGPLVEADQGTSLQGLGQPLE